MGWPSFSKLADRPADSIAIEHFTMQLFMTTAAITSAFSLSSLNAAETSIGIPATTLGRVRVERTKDRITVSTGAIERVWSWTGKGLVTLSLRDAASGKEWAVKPSHACDWDLPGAL